MSRLDELEKEINSGEKKIYGTPGGKEPAAAVSSDKTSDADVQSVDSPTAPTVDPNVTPVDTDADQATTGVVTPTKPKVEEEDWEKRYKGYRAATDATIHGLRQEAITLREAVQKQQADFKELAAKLSSTQETVDVYKDVFTKEERDLIGEETLKTLQKAQEAALDQKIHPLKEQLEQERKQREAESKKSLENDKASLHAAFLKKLEELVPTYKKVDTDRNFQVWMKQPEFDGGFPREILFHRAQNAGDVGRVAEFFNQFIELSKPKDKLAGKVTPVKSGASPQPKNQTQGKPKIDQKFVEKFYEDAVAGKYRGRFEEQQKIEKMIDDYRKTLVRR